MFDVFDVVQVHQGGAEYKFASLDIMYNILNNNTSKITIHTDSPYDKTVVLQFPVNNPDYMQRIVYSEIDAILANSRSKVRVWHKMLRDVLVKKFGKPDDYQEQDETFVMKFGTLKVFASCNEIYTITCSLTDKKVSLSGVTFDQLEDAFGLWK